MKIFFVLASVILAVGCKQRAFNAEVDSNKNKSTDTDVEQEANFNEFNAAINSADLPCTADSRGQSSGRTVMINVIKDNRWFRNNQIVFYPCENLSKDECIKFGKDVHKNYTVPGLEVDKESFKSGFVKKMKTNVAGSDLQKVEYKWQSNSGNHEISSISFTKNNGGNGKLVEMQFGQDSETNTGFQYTCKFANK